MRISDSLDEPLLEDPSKPITRPLSSSQYRFDRLFLKRFHRLLRILFNTNRLRAWSTTKEARKHSVFWLYITFVFIGIGYEIIVYFVGLIPSNFYTILTSRDLAGFIRYIPTCLLLVFAVAACKSLLKFMGELFAIKTRRLLTVHLQHRYIKSKMVYNLLMNQYVDNPDQRITQDVDKFAETLQQIITNLIIAPLMAIYYTYKCWMVTGFFGPLAVLVYFLIGSLLSRRLIQPIVNAVFYKELQEGNFRYLHVRLRQYVESIAFCDGEKEEHDRANQSLNTLLTYQRSIVNNSLFLNMANESFSYLGSIISYFLVAIPIFTGALDGKDAGELSSIISQSSFVIMYLIFLFSTILQQSTKLSDLAGYTARIGELLEALDQVVENLENVEIDHPHHFDNGCDHIEFDHVTLYSPSRKLIVRDLCMTIQPKHHVVFTGSNGRGKTSILRALAGLWPSSEGTVRVPKDILFLPQIPYLVEGSLRNQLGYPSSQCTDESILSNLEKVRLSHLAGMLESFDTCYGQEWYKMLSPGEQQKLVFARIFYANPRFVGKYII
ncbi:ATP-binding cassette sub- D member 4 [Rhizopus azygosporus]|uniref:ATP-binding cassette sub-D member 4 n=1 Tax=Rhizopus azygosporus TaxID=86630 RepID=A0A367KFJ4_RHIAZ|nr:ATP-binding cassette sub- D member 4 [Rhizopus azygosporus]